jgi:transposase
MAKRYRRVDRDQAFLLPPDMRDWLGPDHLVWLVIRVVEDYLDTAAFHAGRRAGGPGAAGYDPDMLVTVLVWAYANGVTSSRRIEALCGTDVAFRVICGGSLPDHCTISRFRAAAGAAAGELFGEVLVLCARLGMGQLGVVTLDGMKIAASASRSASRSEARLRELAAEAAARHGETDAAEDALLGAGRRGDEVPGRGDGQDGDGGGGWSARRRDERIAAALAGLAAERAAREAAAAQAQETAAARVRAARAAGRQPGRGPGGPAGAALAAESLERARAARAAQLADLEKRYRAGEPRRRTSEPGIEDYCKVQKAAARLEAALARAAAAQPAPAGGNSRAGTGGGGPRRNITDPDSRPMPVRGGAFIQGYNTQNAVSADGLIIATALTADPADTAWYEPMLRAAENAAALITASRPAAAPAPGPPPAGGSLIGLFLADAGYLSEHNLTITGPDRLIATSTTRDLEKAARDGTTATRRRTGPATTAMAARLATEDGIAAYRHRGHIAETPHGHIKHNMRFRQLSVRGKPRATAEWQLTATVHNLFKAITAGHLTHAALDTLPAT